MTAPIKYQNSKIPSLVKSFGTKLENFDHTHTRQFLPDEVGVCALAIYMYLTPIRPIAEYCVKASVKC